MNTSDYTRIEQAIRFLEQHALEQPSLDEIAAHIGLSPYHFQRLFKRWAGVSPKRFLQHLTVESAKRLLHDSASVLDTALEVGLSGPGRLHDLFVSVDAVTPGEFKSAGQGLVLSYGFHETPFGECLAATTPRGLCSLGFVEAENRDKALDTLRQSWHAASLVEYPQANKSVIEQIFSPGSARKDEPIKVLLRGTNFQLKVWEALLRIPEGAVTSYSVLADSVGQPGASRAVGSAIGRNPVAYLIPCHRVLRANGEIGGYRWGTVRKKAILAMEASAHQE
jgi:AraC family transcriptional regulator of adaptative response/methylated-DNA-[protein]-cysteine methyltransferase